MSQSTDAQLLTEVMQQMEIGRRLAREGKTVAACANMHQMSGFADVLNQRFMVANSATITDHSKLTASITNLFGS